jgi:L-ascorbate metabolism protein UlaG (beta-lactamase superfamily)
VTRDEASTVTWLGHATVLVEMGGARILTDPLLRQRLGHLRRYAPRPDPALWDNVDAVVISHLHWDHLDLPSLRSLVGEPLIVVPRGAGTLLRRAGLRRIAELEAGECIDVNGVAIRATPANHSGFRPPFGPAVQAAGYVVEGSGRVYFAGDTGLFPEMEDIEGIDVALLPIGGWGPWLRGGHLDPSKAVEALRRIRPAQVLPIHWGTFWPFGLPRGARFRKPGAEFAARIADFDGDVEVSLAPIGERLTIGQSLRSRLG